MKKNKRLEPTIKKKKKDGRPNSIKGFKEEPKNHEWIGLRIHEMKGRRRKAQPVKVKKSLGSPVVRTGLGYLRTARSSGSSGRAAKPG